MALRAQRGTQKRALFLQSMYSRLHPARSIQCPLRDPARSIQCPLRDPARPVSVRLVMSAPLGSGVKCRPCLPDRRRRNGAHSNKFAIESELSCTQQ